MAVPPLAQNALTLVGMFWVLLFIDVDAGPAVGRRSSRCCTARSGIYVRHIQPRLYRVKAMEGESLSIIHEAMSMLRVIVAFGREDHEHRRFRRQGETAIKERIKLTVRQTAVQPGGQPDHRRRDGAGARLRGEPGPARGS